MTVARVGTDTGSWVLWLLTAAIVPVGCATLDPAEIGREALGRGDHAEARRRLAQAVDEHPDDPTLWRDLARAHMRQGALSDARIAITRAAELSPGAPAIVLLRGQIRMGQGDREGARRDAAYVLEHATEPRHLQEVAILFVRLGDANRAIRAADTAVERSGGDADAYTNLAILAVEARRLDVARRAFDEGRARHPKDVPLAEAHAAFLVASGQTGSARGVYRSLLPRHPKPALIHLALALLAHAEGDLADAMQHAEAAVEQAGHERADVHYTYVVVLRDSGRPDDAQRALRKARRKFPGEPDLRRLEAEFAAN